MNLVNTINSDPGSILRKKTLDPDPQLCNAPRSKSITSIMADLDVSNFIYECNLYFCFKG